MLNPSLARVSPAPWTASLSAFVSLWADQIRRQAAVATVLGGSLLILLQTRAFLSGFVDESDNFLGGYLIAHGAVLYRDYFSHHMPLTYWVAALASSLGASTIDDFRIFTALALFGLYLFITLRFQRRLGKVFVSATIATLATTHMLFWGNMLLAETILSWAVLVLFLYVYAWPRLDFSVGDQVVISIAVYAAAMSTLISVYPLVALAGLYVWRRIADARRGARPSLRRELVFIGILSLPYTLTLLWFVSHGLLASFVDQALTFNRVYYARYDLASDPLTILGGAFRRDFHYVRTSLTPSGLLGRDGLGILAAGGAILVLRAQRGYLLAGAYAALLVLTRLREETFHDEAYYVFVGVGVAVVLTWAIQRVQRIRRPDTVFRALGLAAPAVAIAAGVAFFTAAARGHMEVVDYIQPNAYVFVFKDAIDAITEPGDKIWVGPLDPQAYLVTHRAPASRYAFYLPWLSDSPQINQGLVADLTTARPPVVVMPMKLVIIRRSQGAVQMFPVADYAQSLGAFLDEQYVPVNPDDPLWGAVFLRRDHAAAMLDRLKNTGLYVPAQDSAH